MPITWAGMGDVRKAITVLHVEDDPLWTEIIARTIGEWPEVAYIGSCAGGLDAVRQCIAKEPNVLLLDLGLPDIDGFHVARTLAASGAQSRVLLLTSRLDDAALFGLRNPNISGMVWKEPRVAGELRRAITVIHAGHRYFDQSVMHALRCFRAAPDAFFKILTDRELTLIPLFGEGCSNREVADELGLSLEAVRSHKSRIMRKLDLDRPSDLVRWAVTKGFVAVRQRSVRTLA